MKTNIRESTIVIVGAWNVPLFGPEWLSKNIFEGKDLISEISLQSNGPNVRHTFENISITVHSDRLIVSYKELNEGAFNLAEETIVKILEILSHTPVGAMGINFGFVEEDLPTSIASLFDLKDNPEIAKNKGGVEVTEIKRLLRFEDAELFLKQIFADQKVYFEFNYHKDFSGTEDAKKYLKGKVGPYFQRSINLLDTLYNLKLEEEEQENG